MPRPQSISKEIQRINSKLELKQKPWRNTAYWFVPQGLFVLFSYITQDHRTRAHTTYTTICCSLPHQSWIKKMPHMPTGQSDGGNSSTEVPSSQVILVVSNTNQHNNQNKQTKLKNERKKKVPQGQPDTLRWNGTALVNSWPTFACSCWDISEGHLRILCISIWALEIEQHLTLSRWGLFLKSTVASCFGLTELSNPKLTKSAFIHWQTTDYKIWCRDQKSNGQAKNISENTQRLFQRRAVWRNGLCA